MPVQENISLRPYNTFGIDAKARFFVSFKDIDELEETLNFKPETQNILSIITETNIYNFLIYYKQK